MIQIPQILNGEPTAPKVEVLMKHFGKLERDGRVITHEEIERVVGEKRTSNRYRTIVSAWRRRLKPEQGVYLSGRDSAGVGLTVLDASQMVNHGMRGIQHMTRGLGRAHVLIGLAPAEELSAEDQIRRDHAYTLSGVLLQAAVGTRRNLAAINKQPPSSLPKGGPLE